ncbi:MAG: DNA ligase, partial [Candidatus Bathyarchaeia archaeon]
MKEEVSLQFSRVAEVYESIEATTKRLEMTDLLADLLKHASKKIIDKIVYLTQGRLGPTFSSVEMGIAEKLAIQLVARTTGKDNTEIQMSLTKTGDIGETAELLLAKKTQSTLFKTLSLTVLDVY